MALSIFILLWDRVEDPCLTGETFSYAIKNEAFLKKINTETQSKWAGSWFTQCGQVIEPTFQVIWINIYKLPRLSSKESPCDTGDMQQTWVPPLVGKIPLEKEVAAYYSRILAWRILWAEGPVNYSPWGCKQSDTTETNTFTFHFQQRWVIICKLNGLWKAKKIILGMKNSF